MSSATNKVFSGLIFAMAFLLTSGGAQAGMHEGHHSHEQKTINAPAHCEDPSANSEAAFREISPPAAKGDARAQFELGYMYERGKGVPQDYN